MKLKILANSKIKPVTIEVRLRSDGTIPRLMELFQGGVGGILLFDPEGDHPEDRIPAFSIYPNLNLTYEIAEDSDTPSKFTLQPPTPKEYESDERVKKSLKMQKTFLLNVFRTLGKLGNPGHSFHLVFQPRNQGKFETFGWDGDGSDYINLKDLDSDKS